MTLPGLPARSRVVLAVALAACLTFTAAAAVPGLHGPGPQSGPKTAVQLCAPETASTPALADSTRKRSADGSSELPKTGASSPAASIRPGEGDTFLLRAFDAGGPRTSGRAAISNRGPPSHP
jgi:hypothetical protein